MLSTYPHPLSFIAGTYLRQSINGVFMCTIIIVRSIFSEVSTIPWQYIRPALLTSTSTSHPSAEVFSYTLSAASEAERSWTTVIISWAFGPFASCTAVPRDIPPFTMQRVSSSPAAFMSTRTSPYPIAASFSAYIRPIPEAAPVTRA